MSVFMDTQDLRGHLRGLCLLTVVRYVGGPVRCPDFQEVLHGKLGHEVSFFVASVAVFSGIDAVALQGAVEELYVCDDEFLRLENLNMQLGLLSGRPVPIFPFVTESGVDEIALIRPTLDVSKNLIHSAVRLRIQMPHVISSSGEFWPAASRFLQRTGGDSPMAKAIATVTIVDTVSDIIFFNNDAASQTQDVIVVRRINQVSEELKTALAEIDSEVGS